MEFDNLLRKYLSGAMSEAELEHFQSLLDRVPEYKTELRQMLELRSLLHDDALTLTPPPDLSEHVRIAVSSSFAADAVAEWEEETRRRRAFIDPLRITAGALVAACLAVGVALTPTLPHGDADRLAAVGHSGLSSSGTFARASAFDAASTTHRHSMTIAHPRRSGDAVVASVGSDLDDAAWMLDHEVPFRAPGSGTGSVSDAMAELNMSTPPAENDFAARIATADRSGILEHDPSQILLRPTVAPQYNPTLDGATRRQMEPLEEQGRPGGAIAMSDNEGRHLTFGVTLGSGRLMDTTSGSMAMQNSYYFSFNVSGADRIGMEMGRSLFRSESAGDAASAKARNPWAGVTLSDGRVLEGGYIGLVGTPADAQPTKGRAKVSFDTPDPNNDLSTRELPAPPRSGQELKGTKATSGSGSGTGSGGSTGRQTPPQTVRFLEEKITYGAVFYDRRVKLGKQWDLCGRVTVGGADNAIVTNVRAYAAYATGFQNVTITMGVGGSKLYNLSSSNQSNSGSGNFGVYYGIETGF